MHTFDSTPFIRLFVFTLVFSLGLPLAACSGEKLPKGFIAMSEEPLNWEDAKAFCESKGGKLPQINASGAKRAIDNFGTEDGPWPQGFTQCQYWTDSVATGYENYATRVLPGGPSNSPRIDFNSAQKSSKLRAVCVPK